MNNLNDDQKKIVADWAAEGKSLSEIQKLIQENFGITMTYMDVRFLMIDIGAELQDRQDSRTAALKEEPEQVQDETGVSTAAGEEAEPAIPPTGSVSVTLDVVTKPGAVASGTVTFSDGVRATWLLDQLGRLAIEAGQPGYKPSPEDIAGFQQELRRALESRGY